MRTASIVLGTVIAVALPPASHAQRAAGITPETIATALPVEGAPLAVPVMVWGNGGSAINSTRYRGFMTTVASHGFLVMATATGVPAMRARSVLKTAPYWQPGPAA